MITLYHGKTSVCSQKVRLGLAEKGIEWQSRELNLQKGEQQSPEYLKLNPNAVVPTLLTTDGNIIRESSVVLEYIDTLSKPHLMPVDGDALWQTRLWLIRCIEIHAAINSLTFSTVKRTEVLNSMSAEEIDAWIARVPNEEIREKRRDLMKNGVQSRYADGAIHILDGVFRDMSKALQHGPWLMGAEYSLADCALLAYLDRIQRLALSGLFDGRFDGVAEWLKRSCDRESYDVAIQAYIDNKTEAAFFSAGEQAWPEIKEKLNR